MDSSGMVSWTRAARPLSKYWRAVRTLCQRPRTNKESKWWPLAKACEAPPRRKLYPDSWRLSRWRKARSRLRRLRNWLVEREFKEVAAGVWKTWKAKAAKRGSEISTLSMRWREVFVAGRARIIWPSWGKTWKWEAWRLVISLVRRKAVKPSRSWRPNVTSCNWKQTPAKAKATTAGIGTTCLGV